MIRCGFPAVTWSAQRLQVVSAVVVAVLVYVIDLGCRCYLSVRFAFTAQRFLIQHPLTYGAPLFAVGGQAAAGLALLCLPALVLCCPAWTAIDRW
jgi:hypothetical protein